ncbi:phosphate ABC transporter permease subunit PstC [Desulfosporosinus sp.]|uniref:phosphate ABC transporter permease subunit PstC n=1 Tax=Desulfosporosinus sp. TaxID=157907 RepID=UPI000E8389A2|nr:phosphate ABC transporter permease subunit PstC [Desulfosporosinus sp.]MBC2722516.1 phosphate ABC transporter permease subunit PstC [Desulfosporosinus sp.]MBC2727696.1 phosphate ABC transporter permease subunit PstC [Desulfosporosinus sp.]HBV87975.1 phosphate ABC transporter permease subunit PstC [Desulfosporosinus sp.]
MSKQYKLTASLGDQILRLLTLSMAIGVLVLMVWMGWQMFDTARPSIQRFGLGFITSRVWDPVKEQFGALPFIYGTLVTSFLALLLAAPIGLGVAIFLNEMAESRFRAVVGFLVEMLAAIPSVVYGLWGIFVLAPWLKTTVEPGLAKWLGFIPLFQGTPVGFGMLAGGLILAVMILPTIAAISREVMAAVPNMQREAALALGATKWEMIRVAVLPYAKSGIMGGIMLGLGRALGETMAVTMVIGNRPDILASLFAPAYSMAAVIANEFTEATYDLYLSALVEIGLILFGITLVLNFFARLLVWSVGRGPKGGSIV